MSELDVEVVGLGPETAGLTQQEIERLAGMALATAGIADGHLAICFVEADAIADLNIEHRGKEGPTDVLSFPIDGADPVPGPREVGDVVICPAHTDDLREAIVHGVLHLAGMDHETDDGEMLVLQRELLTWHAQDAGVL